ncbi:tail fiber assembly protein [Pseudocitrobacter sp. RIT415]|uniref:tail fiber assembly protein n=1 Tax=Pseudocitrobacter sp. RIT415 TaxID=2202163 RepID=UPI000D3AD4D2|nr:tail fiber assembly protein [Pseudocitrobacter sp. RIT 415]RAU45270.1 tail fiber assembly protein [Pseudocitrobacter sp. RIT 415]
MYFYSPSNNGFYISGFNDSGMPSDVVEIEQAIFNEYSETPPPGKCRVAGDDGFPLWIDIPAPTQDEIIAANEDKRSALRAIADSEIAWRQDSVDAGISTEEETAALTEWKKYRVLLMRVDTTDPEWPSTPSI